MRVRTYGFPGCFTRPPGTSARCHTGEPTTSKPVVPWCVLTPESLGGLLASAHGGAGDRRHVPGGSPGGVPHLGADPRARPRAARGPPRRPTAVLRRHERHAVGPIHLQRIRAEAHVAERTRRRSAPPIRASSTSCCSCAGAARSSRTIGRPSPVPVSSSRGSRRPVRDQGLEPFEALIVVCPAGCSRRDRSPDGRVAGEHLRRRADRPQLLHRPVRQRPGRGRRRAGPFAPARSTVELIQALYVEEDDRGRACGRGTEDLRRDISSYIDANLGDPELDVASIAGRDPRLTRLPAQAPRRGGHDGARHHPRPAAGALPARPARSGVRRRAHRPHRDALGVRERRALQPRVPHGLRRVAERAAGRGRRRDGPGAAITTAVRASRWRGQLALALVVVELRLVVADGRRVRVLAALDRRRPRGQRALERLRLLDDGVGVKRRPRSCSSTGRWS